MDKRNIQRLIDLYNKIHQFEPDYMAIMGDDGEPIILREGSIAKGTKSLLGYLRSDIMAKIGITEYQRDDLQRKRDTLKQYRSEIIEYCKEAGVDPPKVYD